MSEAVRAENWLTAKLAGECPMRDFGDGLQVQPPGTAGWFRVALRWVEDA